MRQTLFHRGRCGFSGTLAGITPAPERLRRTVQQAQRSRDRRSNLITPAGYRHAPRAMARPAFIHRERRPVMGWLFTYGKTKADIIKELIEPQ